MSDVQPAPSGNPLFEGWYADPEIHCFNGRYYLYPTLSTEYERQVAFECWSSDDLTKWKNEGVILELKDVRWSTNYAAWAPSVAEKNGRFYFYFSAGDGAGMQSAFRWFRVITTGRSPSTPTALWTMMARLTCTSGAIASALWPC
jgi:beta-xylosidase